MNLRTVAVVLMLVGAGCASRGSQAQSKVDAVVGDIQDVKISVESAHKEMMATIKALEPVTTADSATLAPAFRPSRPAIIASWATSSASTMWAPRRMMNSFTRP